jgi:predicted TIM-barrel fold metal-dependent hydrolase
MMPLQEYMKLISVDDHVFEHGRVWQDRLPRKYAEAGPRLIDNGESCIWHYEDTRDNAFKYLSTMAGTRHEDYTKEPQHPSDFRPGCLDPTERLKDMDIDGVHAQLCFPSYPRFSGTRFLFAKDKDLALLCVRAYNDWIIDEWCAADPHRYIPLTIVPLWDPQLAASEVRRTAAIGARTIGFPENTVPLDLPSIYTDHWDPFFAAIEETGLPLSMHIGTSARNPSPGKLSPEIVIFSLMGFNSMSAVADWTFSPVFLKFPGVKIVLSEGGIGWMPYLKEKMDYVWGRQRFWSGMPHHPRPSELFDDHVYGCFIEDVVGIKNRGDIGINNILWESDYPHSDTNWPHNRKRAAEMLADVPDKEAHRIVELNARELFSFL